MSIIKPTMTDQEQWMRYSLTAGVVYPLNGNKDIKILGWQSGDFIKRYGAYLVKPRGEKKAPAVYRLSPGRLLPFEISPAAPVQVVNNVDRPLVAKAV